MEALWANWFNLGVTAVGLGTGAGGGFMIIRWILETFFGRFDKRQSMLDKATDDLITRLTTEVTVLTERVASVERSLAECHQAHAASEARVLKLEALAEARGEIRQRAQEVVAADRLAQQEEKKA